MILENMTFKYMDKEKQTRIRILHIDNENKRLYYIDLDKKVSMPQEELVEKIESELNNDILIRIPDPYVKNINEDLLSDIQKSKRDWQWNLVKEYWTEKKLQILRKNSRSRVFEEIAEEKETNKMAVKRVYSRFWQRGMTKNALLPDYNKSGGKGKNKKLSDRKVGKPRKANLVGEIIEGINITEDVKKIFEISLNKYYRKKQKPSLKLCYNSMLREFFSDKYIEDSQVKYQVWNKSKIPSYDQFYYWYRKLTDIQKDIRFRESSKAFDSNYRPTLKNSTIETDGPGTRFQIDATVGDVYLLSSLNRNRIIGRPVIYAVMDVYSRLVTGIYVGLEGPSWLGGMMALDNIVAEKDEFCKSYGINIKSEQWPTKHLPEIIIADRGEFEGYSVENLTNNLNIKIENTPPYRGDLKGIVERYFRTTNEKIKHKTPGAILKEYRQRGDRDYRLDATLTLEEFTQMFIKMVLHHNNKIIDKYPMDKEMISDELTPTPINLWNWGIKNKKGRLRVVEREIMRLNVLPKGKASVSRAGLKFKKLYYSSQKAIEEQWFIKPKHRWIEIVYDPRNINQIYIPSGDGRQYEKCHLLEKSKQYKDCILEEIIFQEELKEELIEWEANNQAQYNIDLDKEIDNIIKKAKKEKQRTVAQTTSKAKKIQGIRENRKLEKEIKRMEEAFEIGKEEKEGIVKAFNGVDNKRNSQEKNTRRLTLMEKIKKQRDEKLGKK